ncbi:predicted protein [Chaetoceros tenuissimus]|uniref:Uncharacterized protein n=1 Tax=Chaetoceros tenuissimus TaxID=426638 RepID=A0AAD3H1L6_9STRA|nr:predicted protein [Chaetoceros tenuissimus]
MRNQHRNQKNNNGQGKRKSYGQTTSNHNGCNRSDQNSKRKDGTLGNDGKGEVRTDVPSSSSPPQRKRRRIMMSGLGLDMIRNHLEIGQGNTKANGTRKNNDLFGNSLPRNDQKQRRGRVQRQENASSTRLDRQQNKAIKLNKEEINAEPKEAKKGNDGIKSIGLKKTEQPIIQKTSTLKNQRAKTMIPSSIQQLNSFLTSSETKPMAKKYVQPHSTLIPDEKKTDSRPLVHEKSIKSWSKESKECCEPEAIVKAKSPTVGANITKDSIDRKRPIPSEPKNTDKKANTIEKEEQSSTVEPSATKDSLDRKRPIPIESKDKDRKANAIQHSSTVEANTTKDSLDRKRPMSSDSKHEDKKANAIQREVHSSTSDANITKDSLDRKWPMSSDSKHEDKKANAIQREVQSSTSDANITKDSLDRKRPMPSESKDNTKSTIKSKRQRMSFSNTEQNIPESSGSLEQRVLEDDVEENEKSSHTSMMEESIGMHTSSCSMKSSPSQLYDDLESTHSSCNILKNEKLHTKSTESKKKTHLSRVEQKDETSNNKSETTNINVNESEIADTSKNSIDEKLVIVPEKYDSCQEQYEGTTKSEGAVMSPKQVSIREIDQDRPKGTAQVQSSPYRMDIWTFSNEKEKPICCQMNYT